MLSDVLISVFLLLSIYWSKKPADEFHMFGHGRSQNVAALVAATILISFMSIETFREAVPKLFQNEGENEFQNINLALIIMIISIIVIAIPIIEILRVKSKGASNKAQIVALLKDEFAFAPSLVAIILVANGYNIADPIASIIIAILIAGSGFYLFKDNFHYLVGKAPDKQFLEKIELIANSVNQVLGVHDLRAEFVGPNIIHTGFHIEVKAGTTIEEADRIAEEVSEKVSKETGCKYCVIHVDPKKIS